MPREITAKLEWYNQQDLPLEKSREKSHVKRTKLRSYYEENWTKGNYEECIQGRGKVKLKHDTHIMQVRRRMFKCKGLHSS